MDRRKDDFYQKLRANVKEWLQTKEGSSSKWAEYLMLAPDFFHLLCKLALDRKVPAREKAKLAVAIAYFISPIDVLPEGFFGPIGYLDDVALAAYVLNSIVNNTSQDIVREHWAGEGDVLGAIQKILRNADDMVGGGLWQKIKDLID